MARQIFVYREVDGKVEREEVSAPPPPRQSSQHQAYASHKPLKSAAAGCHPSQVGEMRDHLKKHGVRGTTVTDAGKVIFSSRAGRAEYNKATGTFDGDAGYGDYAGS
jgi:hypothetical protein